MIRFPRDAPWATLEHASGVGKEMNIPPQYAAWREALGLDELSFGCGGIRMFSLVEMDEAQVGYSRAEDGGSLCDGAVGSWKPKWIVIGYETGLGDPIILD